MQHVEAYSHLDVSVDMLLSAGKEIKLWKYDDNDSEWKAMCSKLPASNVILAKFEPKSNVFATLGKVCRLTLENRHADNLIQLYLASMIA